MLARYVCVCVHLMSGRVYFFLIDIKARASSYTYTPFTSHAGVVTTMYVTFALMDVCSAVGESIGCRLSSRTVCLPICTYKEQLQK